MKLMSIFAILAAAMVGFSSATFKCILGVPYISNGCHPCSCMGDHGGFGCTYMHNCPKRSIGNCTVGTVTQEKCNLCSCIQGQGKICTDYVCTKNKFPNNFYRH